MAPTKEQMPGFKNGLLPQSYSVTQQDTHNLQVQQLLETENNIQYPINGEKVQYFLYT